MPSNPNRMRLSVPVHPAHAHTHCARAYACHCAHVRTHVRAHIRAATAHANPAYRHIRIRGARVAANRAARLYADAHRHPDYRYARARACRYIHARANPYRYAGACRYTHSRAYRRIHACAYTCCAHYRTRANQFSDERLPAHYVIGRALCSATACRATRLLCRSLAAPDPKPAAYRRSYCPVRCSGKGLHD